MSTLEVIVALTLLGTAAIGVGRFAASAADGLRARQLSSRIAWELTNARERIGSWRASEVTAERIESIPFSPTLASHLEAPRWQASVQRIEVPTPAIRVTLALHCLLEQQQATPDQLIFWMADDNDNTETGQAEVGKSGDSESEVSEASIGGEATDEQR
ncbi:MAG: hypothetical protein KDA45_00605 [Planctomycetales bacterium]|nr:hypothetical protein [Planctomycetales bacterium]